MSPRAAASLLEARPGGPEQAPRTLRWRLLLRLTERHGDPGGVRVEVLGLWTAGAMLWSAALGSATGCWAASTPRASSLARPSGQSGRPSRCPESRASRRSGVLCVVASIDGKPAELTTTALIRSRFSGF